MGLHPEVVCWWGDLASRTFPSAPHVVSPGPVLPRGHGAHIVLRVGMHGLAHQRAVHVYRVIAVGEYTSLALVHMVP